jgi:hypothetical protein
MVEGGFHPKPLSDLGSFFNVSGVCAAAEPSFDVLQLVMDLPFFTVSTPYQAYELGLNNDSFGRENAHESTVAPKQAQRNQRRLYYSCNNRVIDKLN